MYMHRNYDIGLPNDSLIKYPSNHLIVLLLLGDFLRVLGYFLQCYVL